MEDITTIFWISSIIVASILGVVLWLNLRCPFLYPYYTYKFDVSGRRKPDINNLIDTMIIEGDFDDIMQHQEEVEKWKSDSLHMVEKSLFKKRRMRQYKRVLDDGHAYKFILTRLQTRYKQVNYVKHAYKVEVAEGGFEFSYKYLMDRYNELSKIDFECTLKDYHSKNQRKLATRELREKIMRRDDYTCQICGKYMPDEVGLQVDHIIPIAKGGKTVESNLQILCSKCNSSKSSKILEP